MVSVHQILSGHIQQCVFAFFCSWLIMFSNISDGPCFGGSPFGVNNSVNSFEVQFVSYSVVRKVPTSVMTDFAPVPKLSSSPL